MALVAIAGCGSGDGHGTALRELGGFTSVSGVVTQRDKPFTYGAVAVSNRDSETVTLRSVQLVGRRGLRLLGSYVNTTDNGAGLWPSFPSPGARVKPLDGITVPHDPPGVELMLKLVRRRPGTSRFTALSITYDQGGETKTQVFHRKLTIWTKPRWGANVNAPAQHRKKGNHASNQG
jgi:hypothetical protein